MADSIGPNLSEAIASSKLQRLIPCAPDFLVVWNGSATFGVWIISVDAEVDVFTRYGNANGGPCTFDQAVEAIDAFGRELAGEVA